MGLCNCKKATDQESLVTQGPKSHPSDKEEGIQVSKPPRIGKQQTKPRFSEAEHVSASLIQRRFRDLVARVIAKRAALLHSWNELDRKEERELKAAHSEYIKLKQTYAQKHNFTSLVSHDDDKRSIQDRVDIALNKAKEMCRKHERKGRHNGFQIASLQVLQDKDKMNEMFVTRMLDQFKRDSILSYENVFQILKRVTPILKEHENVVDVSIEGNQKVCIVGDIHGQLEDLLTILDMNGWPSKDNLYVFNGDFVDRGQNSAECVLAMFALKIVYPDSIHLNRGNHESRDMNAMDGFEREILDKYDAYMFNLFSEVFGCLPLATVIQDKIFVVHAGLAWEDITIKQLLDLNRFYPIPPDRSIMQSLLWSDPDNEPGRQASRRGAGVQFGADVLDRFLTDNGLDMLVRSHECVDEGYEKWFDDKLITIFSASNYCGDMGNYGAFMTVTPDLKKKIHQYEANAEVRKTMLMRDEQLKASVISKLIRRISVQRHTLLEYWKRIEGKDGKISRVQWSAGLNHVLDLQDVPFLQFQLELGIEPPTRVGERIEYIAFLNKYRPAHSDIDEATTKDAQGKTLRESLNQLIFSQRYQLEGLFRHFDINKDGAITVSEFSQGIHALMDILGKDYPLEEIMKVMSSIDKDGNGEIDYQEFFEAFGPSDAKVSARLLPRQASVGWMDGGVQTPRTSRRPPLSRAATSGAAYGMPPHPAFKTSASAPTSPQPPLPRAHSAAVPSPFLTVPGQFKRPSPKEEKEEDKGEKSKESKEGKEGKDGKENKDMDAFGPVIVHLEEDDENLTADAFTSARDRSDRGVGSGEKSNVRFHVG